MPYEKSKVLLPLVPWEFYDTLKERSSMGDTREISPEEMKELVESLEIQRENFLKFKEIIEKKEFLSNFVNSMRDPKKLKEIILFTLESMKRLNEFAEALNKSDYIRKWYDNGHIQVVLTLLYENPGVVRQVKEVNKDFSRLEDILKDNPFFGNTPSVVGEGHEKVLMIDGNLEVRIYRVNQQEVKPVEIRNIKSDETLIKVGDEKYYNGLPKDREKFPSALFYPGDKVKVTVKNKSDNTYTLIPFINGIPIWISKLKLDIGGFSKTPLPITEVKPLNYELAPGKEVEIKNFYLDEISLYLTKSDWDLNFPINEFSYSTFYLYYLTLPELELEKVNKFILLEKLASFYTFLESIRKPREADIIISSPEIIYEEEKYPENPYVGSLGFLVVKKEEVKKELNLVSADLEIRHSEKLEKGSFDFPKGIGYGGLSHVEAGRGREARWRIHEDTGSIKEVSKLVGYFPVNTMSLIKERIKET